MGRQQRLALMPVARIVGIMRMRKGRRARFTVLSAMRLSPPFPAGSECIRPLTELIGGTQYDKTASQSNPACLVLAALLIPRSNGIANAVLAKEDTRANTSDERTVLIRN